MPSPARWVTASLEGACERSRLTVIPSLQPAMGASIPRVVCRRSPWAPPFPGWYVDAPCDPRTGLPGCQPASLPGFQPPWIPRGRAFRVISSPRAQLASYHHQHHHQFTVISVLHLYHAHRLRVSSRSFLIHSSSATWTNSKHPRSISRHKCLSSLLIRPPRLLCTSAGRPCHDMVTSRWEAP